MLLDYRIDARRPELRELGVTLEFDLDAADGTPVRLFVPVWTPGSYLIREYGRHFGRVAAHDAGSGAALACRKVAKNRFEVAPGPATRRVRVTWSVHAHELTVRTADLTAAHAFWNHACVLLWPVDQPHRRARIVVDHRRDWHLACSLPRESKAAETTTTAPFASTTLLATDLDEAMDAPCLVGDGTRLDWTIDGVPHAIVLDGAAGIAPPPTLLDDLTRVVTTARAVFGGGLPYANYVFLCLFAAEGHGGLEHAASTTLLAARTALAGGKDYREFLSLCAHELFHAWNVKRMRPAEFWRYDYEQENYTSLLWLIEGWTAYYDDLVCRRAGLSSRDEYLALLAKNIDTLRTSPGRLRLSLAESSFDAWIRLYRPDANTRNSSQNYYLNGSLAALCLDLFLLEHSGGARCLDDVLRRLYHATFGHGRGYTREDVEAALREVAGDGAVRKLAELVDGALDPDFAAAFAPLGVQCTVEPGDRPQLGVTFTAGGTTISAVEADGPAFVGGLAPGDELIALGDLRVDGGRWAELWRAVARVGQPLEVLLARRGVMTRCTVVPGPARGTTRLKVSAEATPTQAHLRERWLDPFGNDARPAAASTETKNA
ncbi:MAG: M61 family metallopeptidase [Planctomycetes bacterium]|nr:M61 family metallopeptidase [Planctomycetota bacterium]